MNICRIFDGYALSNVAMRMFVFTSETHPLKRRMKLGITGGKVFETLL
jgi:hypothetical protein